MNNSTILIILVLIIITFKTSSIRKSINIENFDKEGSFKEIDGKLNTVDKDEINDLILGNMNINAVKRVREITGCSILEAKNYVDHILR